MSDLNPESNRVKHAMEVVCFAKRVSREVASFRIPDDVDFVGASYSYVKEKLDTAIADLRWMKNRMKEVDQLKKRSTL